METNPERPVRPKASETSGFTDSSKVFVDGEVPEVYVVPTVLQRTEPDPTGGTGDGRVTPDFVSAEEGPEVFVETPVDPQGIRCQGSTVVVVQHRQGRADIGI